MPSTSADGTGISETGNQLAELIGGVGGCSQIYPTSGHPIVYCEFDLGRPRMLLVYGNNDVSSVEVTPKAWKWQSWANASWAAASVFPEDRWWVC